MQSFKIYQKSFKIQSLSSCTNTYNQFVNNFQSISPWDSKNCNFGKERGLDVISKCENFMIKVAQKTHQTGFIILSFWLSTEMFFLVTKIRRLFAFLSLLAFPQLGFCVKWEYSAVCWWANGWRCQRREEDIFSF